MTILADQPELVALANLAAVAPSKVAQGFNDPERLFEHLSLDELARLKAATDRLAMLAVVLANACDMYARYAQAILEQTATKEPTELVK